MRRTTNNAAGERSEPAATEASVVSYVSFGQTLPTHVATGDERFVQHHGRRLYLRVVGPMDRPPKRRWYEFWRLRERWEPMFEWVTIKDTGDEGAKPLRMLIKANSLTHASDDDIRHTVEYAEDLSLLPPAAAALALVRSGSEYVLDRGQWNVILATASICKWEPDRADMLSDAEAAGLRALFAELREKLGEKGLKELAFLPPEGFEEFLCGGGFVVREIG